MPELVVLPGGPLETIPVHHHLTSALVFSCLQLTQQGNILPLCLLLLAGFPPTGLLRGEELACLLGRVIPLLLGKHQLHLHLGQLSVEGRRGGAQGRLHPFLGGGKDTLLELLVLCL